MTARRETILKAYFCLLWAVCAYRAITQSIVHDEALTYQLYLAGPAARIFDFFDANHHFLNTLLMKLSVSLFGVSEWSMRLPALAGAALYFAAVYRICTREFQNVWASLGGAAVLTLNPLVLDFMVAARGYALGLALWMWAFAVLLDHLRQPAVQNRANLWIGGAALGLSIAANLIFAVPAVVLAGIAWMLRLRAPREQKAEIPATPDRKKKTKKPAKPLVPEVRFWRDFVVPATGVAILFFLFAPLDKANTGNFYVGAGSIVESLRNLATVSIAHGGPWRNTSANLFARDAIAFCLGPLVVAAAAIVGLMRRNVLLLLTSGTIVGSALILLILHLVLQFPFPLDRTGIYFLALIPLALAGLAEAASGANAPAGSAAVFPYGLACVLMASLVVEYAAQFNTREFLVWEYDADTRTIAGRIAQLAANQPPGSVRVGGSWQFEPSLNFYREKDRLSWMQPVDRNSITPGFDYYVIRSEERGAMKSLGLKPVYEGAVSGSILAVPSN
jgi:hypothetical protein